MSIEAANDKGNQSLSDSASSLSISDKLVNVAVDSGFEEFAVSFDALEDSKRPLHVKRSRKSSSISNDPAPKLHKRKLKKMLESMKDPEVEYASTHKNITLKTIQSAIIGTLTDKVTGKSSAITFKSPQNVVKFVVCVVGGLRRADFVDTSEDSFVTPIHESARQKFPFIANTFKHALKLSSPGTKNSISSPIDVMCHISLKPKDRQKLEEESKNQKITINDLLLSKEFLSKSEYPVHNEIVSSILPQGWKETQKFEHEGSHIFSVDCEFCQTLNGKELARISVINFQNDVVLDEYVKPKEMIIDYLTKYSGITEQLLEGVTTTLEDIQDTLLELVSSDDILIGHSLSSDLNILKIRHPNIVDTCFCYHHVRGPPYRPGLKWLTKTHLSRDIQMGELSGEGHSSVEDARACLDLVKLKIQEGRLFGVDSSRQGVIDHINEEKPVEKPELKHVAIDYQSVDTGSGTMIQVDNDNEVVDNFTREVDDADFLVLGLKELEASLGWSSCCRVKHDLEDSYTNLNNRLNTIYSLLPANSVFMVLGSHGQDSSPLNNLFQQRRVLMGKQGMGENVNKDLDVLRDSIKQEVHKLREAVGFVTIKPSDT
ncbi:hypothetical protein CANTEDRAFT_111603 [Yamadazyma tenuis ATCC 10573]|nr:uncharacterized protein CANTEDRAFT_111603 [Yamadazyma tenuis ATCC 10573]EGV60415.1 hypothetical protein CANTEDRAFT_111603 [Yamadazyma tenuis ATCC 10573]